MEQKPEFCTSKQLENYLTFLDDLHSAGAVNMFAFNQNGAGKYLQENFGVNESEAFELLAYWQKTLSARRPPADNI